MYLTILIDIFQFTGMILALQIVSNRSAITIILGAEKLTSAFYHLQKPNGENTNNKMFLYKMLKLFLRVGTKYFKMHFF